MSRSFGFFSFLKRSIPRAIWAIGISSLLINSATAVVFSGSALYLKTVLGVSVAAIGFIEAIVEAVAYAIRIFSGMLSDYLKNRKRLMVVGFIMLTIAKPLLAFSKNLSQVFLARTIDRIGNGIQATPRDALVSDIAPKDLKGACFGLRQSLSVIGSTIGGLLGVLIMKSTNNDFEQLFLLVTIPAALSVLLLLFFVKEKKAEAKAPRNKLRMRDIKNLGKKFWMLMFVVMIFMSAKFSESFISLHACGNFNLDLGYITLITTLYNLISTLVAYPIGRLSDRSDRLNILLVGFCLLFVAHLFLGFAVNLWMIFIGTIIWGAHIGITQSIFSTLVSDYVPQNLRGTGFGIYYLVVAVSTGCASMLAGKISDLKGEALSFLIGAVICFIAIAVLVMLKSKLKTAEPASQK